MVIDSSLEAVTPMLQRRQQICRGIGFGSCQSREICSPAALTISLASSG